MSASKSLSNLRNKIKEFVKERDWEKYHSPKNLSMSIAVETAELMEHFQWLTSEESKLALKDKKKRKEIESELADIAIYIFDFCNLFNVDIEKSILKKLKQNSKKYPVRLVKGKAHKYTFYQKQK